MLKIISLIVSLFVDFSGLYLRITPNANLYFYPNVQNVDSIQSLIQQEINRTKIRFDPILSTWILAAILIPTSATLCVLVLAFKYGRNVQSVSTDMTTTQSQTLSQMKSRISEVQILVDSIHQQIKISQENAEKIEEKIQNTSDSKKS
jgi:multisubunit Na+/H+ antiporter MnhC subunit